MASIRDGEVMGVVNVLDPPGRTVERVELARSRLGGVSPAMNMSGWGCARNCHSAVRSDLVTHLMWVRVHTGQLAETFNFRTVRDEPGESERGDDLRLRLRDSSGDRRFAFDHDDGGWLLSYSR